jgi:4-amino-4-deoxy-L-arabinose transferase-like glycosyltransferase
MSLTQRSQTLFLKNKLLLLIFAIWVISLSFRMSVYDPTIPILLDALNFLSYAIDINVLGGLPENYAVSKPGWSILLAGLFSVFDFSETNSYMQLQRITSIFISSIIIFPVYFLCNVFVEKKYSIIGATMFAFAPRLVENSMYGSTEPLFILFLTTTILLFLKNSKKCTYISFLFAGISTLIRPEGFFLFLAMSFLLIFKLKNEKFKFPKYLSAITIFFIVLLPFALYTEDTNPEMSVFSRIIGSSAQYFQTSDEETHITSDNRLVTTSKISAITGI